MPVLSRNSFQEFEPAPVGNHVARCVGVIVYGTITEQNQWGEKTALKGCIIWELPEEVRDFKGEEKPMTIRKEYNLSLDSRATLSVDLCSWRGKKFTEEELKGFELFNILNATCFVNVIHNEASNGKTYANVDKVTPLSKSVKCPDRVNELIRFDFDDYYSEEFIESQSDYIKDKIKSSAEYKKKKGVSDKTTIKSEELVPRDTDLPF